MTHERRLIDCEALIAAFLNETSSLAHKRGVLLVQLPPSFGFERERVARYFTALRAGYAGRVACEPRHRSWFETPAETLLRDFAVARVAADPPLVPQAARTGAYDGFAYYRWHGSPRTYYSAYDDARIEAFAASLDSRIPESWCIFDNTALGAATHNALRLQQHFPGVLTRRAPEIETARLVLRAHRLTDLAACAAMWADPAVTRYISGKPSTLQQTWSRVLTYAGLWALLGFGYWAVEEKVTGTFVGELGFADFKRALGASIAGLPELGWAFVAHAHGRGYATEALSAALTWCDYNLGVARTICIVDPGNTASLRVAQKCGYAELLRVEYGGKLVVVFDRFAPSEE